MVFAVVERDASVGVALVCGFDVSSFVAVGVLNSVMLVLSVLMAPAGWLVVCSLEETSGLESTSLVTLPPTLPPVGVGALGIVTAFVILLLTDSI